VGTTHAGPLPGTQTCGVGFHGNISPIPHSEELGTACRDDLRSRSYLENPVAPSRSSGRVALQLALSAPSTKPTGYPIVR